MFSPPVPSVNKCLESRKIAIVCADCHRIQGPEQKCSLASSPACEGISFHLSMHKGAPESSPPCRADARHGFCSVPSCCWEGTDSPVSASASGSAVFPCPCSSLPGPLTPGKGRGKDGGVTKDVFREQQDNPASVPQPELSPPSVPRRGSHRSFPSPGSHCTCLLLPGPRVWLAQSLAFRKRCDRKH